MRERGRVDTNQAEITEALRKHGATVQDLSGVGKGCPDKLVGWRGRNYLMEIKDGKKPPSRRALSHDQVIWLNTWEGSAHVVTSVEDALAVLT